MKNHAVIARLFSSNDTHGMKNLSEAALFTVSPSPGRRGRSRKFAARLSVSSNSPAALVRARTVANVEIVRALRQRMQPRSHVCTSFLRDVTRSRSRRVRAQFNPAQRQRRRGVGAPRIIIWAYHGSSAGGPVAPGLSIRVRSIRPSEAEVI